MTQQYVLGDWGTTRLRLHRMRNGIMFDRLEGPGIGSLDAPAIRVLMNRIEDWRAEGDIEEILLCGMAGARGGLVEAPYLACPATVDAWRGAQTRMMLDGLRISVAPGLSYRSPTGIPDVMRGEETQIFGAMAVMPDLAHGEWLLLLPGTHSKWARVRDGAITGFRTCPTGETFALFTQQSTLVGPDAAGTGSFDEGFRQGYERRTDPLGPALFEARAARMLDGRSRDWAKGFLSGLLIGSEIHALAPAGEQVIVIGDPALWDLYRRALSASGVAQQFIDGEAAVLAGLERARGRTAA
jgi:2-dehydro-3-deoxygalactonokinase